MSKRALAILAAVEGLVIIGLVVLLAAGAFAAPSVSGAPWAGRFSGMMDGRHMWGGYGPGFDGGFMHGGMGWFGGAGLLWLVVRGAVGLLPIVLVALIVAWIMRRPEARSSDVPPSQ